MNFKRGFRRIIFVLSLLASLTAAELCFYAVFDTWDSEQVAYNDSKNNYEEIIYFWLAWDSDAWTDGKKGVINELLNNRSVRFSFDDNKIAHLYAYQVFPGINKDMLAMPLTTLDKEAQIAKNGAIDSAKQQVKSHEFWGMKSAIEAIFIGIAAALGVAGLGFLAAWVICAAVYKFSKWLILGFRDDTCNQIEKEEPSQ